MKASQGFYCSGFIHPTWLLGCGNACMLVCGDFIYTLEIIARILREVVNRDRLCGTNAKASGLPQFLGLSDPLQKYQHNLSLFGLLEKMAW